MRHMHCPFCGSDNHHAVVAGIAYNWIQVECRECGAASGPQLRYSKPGGATDKYDVDRAYSTWNVRHADPKPEPDYDDHGDNMGYNPDDWGDR